MVGFRGGGVGFSVENEGKGEGHGEGGVWEQAKEPASQCARVCQNCALANYPQQTADVWKKDVWDFQAFSQTFLELRFSLGNEGKDGKNLNSQTWPGTPRRHSARHPRPPDTLQLFPDVPTFVPKKSVLMVRPLMWAA